MITRMITTHHTTYPECLVKLVGIDVGTGSWLSTTTATTAVGTAERVSSEKHDKVREKEGGFVLGYLLELVLYV